MLAEVIRTLYDYNEWATERIFDTAARLTPEQLEEPGTAGWGSIRTTLLHLVSTQRSWLSYWDGSLAAAEAIRFRLDPADYPDLAAVRAAWDAVAEETRAFVRDLSDEDLTRLYTAELPGRPAWSMPLWKMMLHVANHGTQHRSEVAAMLTAGGHSPGYLDLLFYYMERGQRGAQ